MSGTGKTTLFSTFPGKKLLIDVKDKGTESAKGKNTDEIDVFPVDKFDDLYDLYDYIQDQLEDGDPYEVVCIDTLTKLQDLCREKVLEEEKKSSMTIQLHGYVAEYMKEIIDLYKNLSEEGITPIFLCQMKSVGGEGEGEDQLMPEVGPELQKSTRTYLNAVTRVLAQTYIQENITSKAGKVDRHIEWRLRIGPNPFYMTKVTKSKDVTVPMYVADPTYDKLMDAMAGKLSDEPKKKKRSRKKK